MTTLPPAVRPETLAQLLRLLRDGLAATSQELANRTGLSSGVVREHVAELTKCGLVEHCHVGSSTDSAPSPELRFRSDEAVVLVAEIDAEMITVGVADLSGRLLDRRQDITDVRSGPETPVAQLEGLFDGLLATLTKPTWGIGVGALGPVDAVAGRILDRPLMTGWGGYPLRQRLADRYDVPVWVDNEVNLMAVGELRAGAGRGHRNLVYVKLNDHIRAGLISNGQLHRGEQGTAGEIGHVTVVDEPPVPCWCGSAGCLIRFAGGDALAASATRAASEGRSPILSAIIDERGHLNVHDIAAAAALGDNPSMELIHRAGTLTGKALAPLVNTFNPAQILVGGSVAVAGDALLAAIRHAVYLRSVPLATRDLEICYSPLGASAALVGAAFTVIDQLFSAEILAVWSPYRSTRGLTSAVYALATD